MEIVVGLKKLLIDSTFKMTHRGMGKPKKCS